MKLDKQVLLDYLASRLRVMKSPLTQAIYAGLIARIQRGDFDT